VRDGDWERRRNLSSVGGILDVRVSPDELSLTLRVCNCGEEVTPAWTIDEMTVRISATVKRPFADGDCTSGEAVEIGIGLNEPLADRTIIDGRTGSPPG
jgi:hypothetical protein